MLNKYLKCSVMRLAVWLGFKGLILLKSLEEPTSSYVARFLPLDLVLNTWGSFCLKIL